MAVGMEAPDMNVVDFLDARHGEHSPRHRFEMHPFWQALKQNV